MGSILEELNYPKKILEIAEEIFGKLLGPAITESGELIADRIRAYRFKNQIKILNDLKKLLEENGLSPKQIPLKLAVPLLENASLEEDVSLQEMWTRLIMNASTSDYKISLHKLCAEILSDLSPTEARILELIKSDVIKKINEKKHVAVADREAKIEFIPSQVFYLYYEIQSKFKLEKKEREYILDNLVRLRILKWEPSGVDDNTIDFENIISLSSLGYCFLEECTDLKKYI